MGTLKDRIYFDLQLFNDDAGSDVADTTADTNESDDTDLPSSNIGLKDGQLHFFDSEEEQPGEDDGEDLGEESQDDVEDNNYLENNEPEQIPQVQPQQPIMQPPIVQQQEVQPPHQQPEQQVDVTAQIAEVAQKLVEQKFGTEFDQFDTRHMAEYTMAVSRIEREANEYVVNQQRQQAEQNQVMQTFQATYQEMQAKDKENFAEIDNLSKTYMENMPYNQAKPIIEAVERFNTGKATLKDVDTVKSYWEVCRSEYYAKKTGIGRQAKPIQPPRLETPGQGDTVDKESFDPKKLGKMTQDERIAYFKQSGFADKLLNF